MEMVEVSDSVRPEMISSGDAENQLDRHAVNDKEISPVVNSAPPDVGEASTVPCLASRPEPALFDEATRSLEQQPPRSPSSEVRECSPLPTRRGTRAGDESASASSSDDEPIIGSVVGSVRPDESAVWKKSKSYEYIPHIIQPDPSLFGHVLLTLRVRQGRDWMTLDAESGQYVFMGGRKFQLIMIMLVGKYYRVWIHSDAESFVVAAMHVEAPADIPARAKIAAQKGRLQVVLFFICFVLYLLCVVVLVNSRRRSN